MAVVSDGWQPAGERDRVSLASFATLALAIPAAMFDGFDGQLIAFVAPAIAADWKLPKSEFGMIFSVGLVGLIIGAMFVAPLADRFGRRFIAIAGSLVVALFTVVTAFVRDPVELGLARMLTGIGLGTLMSVLVTITQEAAPPRLKGVFVTILVTAFPFGGFVGGLLVAWGLNHVSWREIFLFAGGVAAAFPLLFWFFLRPVQPALAKAEAAPPTTVLTLFRDGRFATTALLWTLFFVSLLNIYTLSAWLPLLLQRGGIAVQDALHITAIFGLGGTIGGVLLGLATVRFGGHLLVLAYALAAAALVGISIAPVDVATTMGLATTFGFMILGGHVGNTVLAARLYPPSMNATGIGWAQGLGRVGCVVGPALVGFAIAAGAGNEIIFLGAAVFASVGAAAVFGVARIERKLSA